MFSVKTELLWSKIETDIHTIDWGGWSPCFRPHEAYALLTEGDTGGAIGAGSHTSHRGDAVAGREPPTSGPLSGERLFGRPVLNTCCSQAWTGESAAIGLVSTIPCDIDWGAAVLLACVGISRCCGGGRWALRAGRRRCAMLLRTCRGCVLWWCGSRLYNVNGGLRARTLLQAAVGRRSAVCMRVVGFDLLRARTRSHIRLCIVRTLQQAIQAHKTKFKRIVERPKTHIGTSSQGPGAVPSSARLGIFWRAQGRVPWQTTLIYATSTVIVGGATWIVIDPPSVRATTVPHYHVG